MPDPGFSYSEDILQWIWKEQLFDARMLESMEGKSIKILDPGTQNTTDGPDFKNARIYINGLTWAGSIELHLTSKGWEQHGHIHDKAYDQVILHVVAEDNPRIVKRTDGTSIPTLNLLPYLPEELNLFIRNMNLSTALPCASGVNYLSNEVFLKQLDKAHKEYLEKKGDDFLQFYNPDLPPGKAWKEALILSVFDGYGIAHNREPMVEVGRWFLQHTHLNTDEIISEALIYAGFGACHSKLSWNYKGVYPASHPKVRIPEAIHFAIQIMGTDLGPLFEKHFKTLWMNWSQKAGISSSKREMLYGIVFLPAIYIFANLFRARILSQQVLEEWNLFRAIIPSSITKSFTFLEGIPESTFKNKLGLVHQHRSYCGRRRCHECLVLKKVISS